LVPTPKGNQFVFSLVGEGYVIGSELAVVSGDSPGDIFVAVSDAEVCLLSVESVKAALQEDPALLKEITIAVVNNGIAFIQQSWILQGMSTTSRVKRFFSVYLSRFSKENQSEVVVPISHRLLALIINAERASVTRAIKQLHDSGLLIKRSKSIVLKTKLWTPDVENSDDIWGPSLSIEPT
jgi:CRP-like cAMP-binding protein